MSLIRETIFDLVLNAFLQIGLFAIVTACFSRLVAKARAKYQYVFYLAVFLFCLAAPVINTIWRTHPITGAGKSLQQVLPEAGGAYHRFWEWQGHSERHEQFTLGPEVQGWIVALWGGAGPVSSAPLQPRRSSSSSAPEGRLGTFSCRSRGG
jgi:hypothetical protein